MRNIQFLLAILVILSILSNTGCFQEIVETREPLPDIIWPRPPEIARIRFVNSISKPEHVGIRDRLSSRLLSFLKGKIEPSIVHPYGITTDVEGRLYVVDTFSKHIHVFDSKNNVYYFFPDKATEFLSPIDIAIDRYGNIYVSDSIEGVVKVFRDNGKEYIRDIGKGLLNRPTGLAYHGKSEELLVVDTKNSEIVRYDINKLRVKGIVGREGTANGSFHNPTNIFVARNGKIFVTDSLNFRIQIFDQDWNFLRSFGKAGDSPGFFARPRGVAVDSEGNIYVVDALFDNVQIFNEKGKLLMDFGSPGNGYGEFWLPSGIFIDANDMIYVSDSYNKRVQVFEYLRKDKL